MISRKDFVFTVGYDGNTAVVDGAMRRRYGSLSTEELAEEGLFKEAVCSAVYEQAEEAAAGSGSGQAPAAGGPLVRVLQIYNRGAEKKIPGVEGLKRTFGVFEVPEGIGKVMVI